MMYTYQLGASKRDYKSICMAVIVCGVVITDVQQEARVVYNAMRINDNNRITVFDIDGFLMEHVGKLSGFRVNIVPNFNCVKLTKSIKISGMATDVNVDHVGEVLAHNVFFEVKNKVRLVWSCGKLDAINPKRGDQYNSVQIVFSNLKENNVQLPIGLAIENFPYSEEGGCFGGMLPEKGTNFIASVTSHGPGGFRHYGGIEDLAGNLNKSRFDCAMAFLKKLKNYNAGDIYDEEEKPSFHRADSAQAALSDRWAQINRNVTKQDTQKVGDSRKSTAGGAWQQVGLSSNELELKKHLHRDFGNEETDGRYAKVGEGG